MVDNVLRVDVALRETVRCEDPLLTEIAGHLLSAGGKRQRPAFCIAAAAAAVPEPLGPAVSEAVMGGVSVELVHLGSLYHDDVMDEADTRRTVESVNARWGDLKAILGGDFLLAKASEVAATLGTEVAGLLARTIADLCEGQVVELQNAFDVDRSEEAYLRAIHDKTAVLFATSCKIGALVAGLGRRDVDALAAFGENYGMAFQIVDDILDVVSTDELLGKPAGNDIIQGVYTLPVIRALSSRDGGALRNSLGRPGDMGAALSARDLVRSNGAVTSAIATATEFTNTAIGALDHFGDTPSVEAMRNSAAHLIADIPRS